MSKKLRNLCKREGWTCHLCGGKVLDEKPFRWNAPKAPTRDHVIPRSIVRKDPEKYKDVVETNVRLAHYFCNLYKGDQEETNPAQLRELIEQAHCEYQARLAKRLRRKEAHRQRKKERRAIQAAKERGALV